MRHFMAILLVIGCAIAPVAAAHATTFEYGGID
jgi:hypothetical protein